MFKTTLTILIFSAVIQVAICYPRGPYASDDEPSGPSRRSFVGSRNRYISSKNRPTTTTLPPTPKEILDQHGISMFTLILLITLFLLAAIGFYYTVMCYPFLCSNEKNYNFMDVSSTMTAATSRSINS
uniref:Uncharacterized protein n=1 Tax=Megaselia scalaris TaxID=36166 RepID=T1GXR7_MEGSC